MIISMRVSITVDVMLPLLVGAHQLHLQSTNDSGLTANAIPYSTRAQWMRKANEALSLLSSPCPFAAFGTAIVNHTAVTEDGSGELVCIGINENARVGSPTLHGECLSLFCVAQYGTDQ